MTCSRLAAAAVLLAPLAATAAPLGLPTSTPFLTEAGEASNDSTFFGFIFDGPSLFLNAFVEPDGTPGGSPDFGVFDDFAGFAGTIEGVGFTIDATGEDIVEFLLVPDSTSTGTRSVATITGEFSSDPATSFRDFGDPDAVPASVSVAAVIPLPAALPLTLAGLGAFVMVGRRRR